MKEKANVEILLLVSFGFEGCRIAAAGYHSSNHFSHETYVKSLIFSILVIYMAPKQPQLF